MSRKTKSISFDLTDAHEKGLLEYVESKERGKFSRYIKRLIAEDKKGVVQSNPAPTVRQADPVEIEVNTDGFL